MTLPTPYPPDDALRPSNPDVQHVRAVRSGGGSEDTPAAAGVSASFSISTTSSLGGGATTFFTTFKRMALLALVAALAAAWWAERGSTLRGIATAIIVFFPAVGFGIVLAGNLTAASVAAATWRQSGLTRQLLALFISRMSGTRPTDERQIDGSPFPQATPSAYDVASAGPITRAEAEHRLDDVLTGWMAESTGASGVAALLGRAKRRLGELVAQAVRAEIQRQAKVGPIELSAVARTLADRIDDDVEASVRRSKWVLIARGVGMTIGWAAVIAYVMSQLAK